MFVLLQRYTFWSNSQPNRDHNGRYLGCLYYCKDTLFEAIHNPLTALLRDNTVVCITAKIHFLKQFTTHTCRTFQYLVLFVLLQRYTFWSNSQLGLDAKLLGSSCLYYCKDTLFEAIHNTYPTDFVSANVVCITAKIHFLKQFTTDTAYIYDVHRLFVLLQRYTFWSNSQPCALCLHSAYRCLYYCKDTLFEAIHNYALPHSLWAELFVLLQRYTFWSNSQPHMAVQNHAEGCLYYCKDTLFEAIHNGLIWGYRGASVVCITAKIHFLKQFTTYR